MIPGRREPSESFTYPSTRTRPGGRMCADGQRRAALYATRIYEEVGSGAQSELVTSILERAARAERRQAKGGDQTKIDLIAHEVLLAYANGKLSNYVTPEGDFLLSAYDGTTHERNVHTEVAAGKRFFK